MTVAVINLNQRSEEHINQDVTYERKGHLSYQWVCITEILYWKERGDEQGDKDKINGQCQSGDSVILTH